MKSIVFAVVFLVSSLAFAEENFKPWHELDREMKMSLFKEAKIISTAKIQRGNTEIAINFSKAADVPKIKPSDVVLLEEGVYTNLGGPKARHVRFIGKGPKKTFLSTAAGNGTSIAVDGTEFWDLSLVDSQFKLVSREGIWAINIMVVGSVLIEPASEKLKPHFLLRSLFSDLIQSDIPLTNQDPKQGWFQLVEGPYHHLHSMERDKGYNWPLERRYQQLPEKQFWLPQEKELNKKVNEAVVASAFSLNNKVDFFDPTRDYFATRVTAEIWRDYESLYDERGNSSLKDSAGYKGLLARGSHYMISKGHWKADYDKTKHAEVLKKAQTAKAKGNTFLAVALYSEADRIALHSTFDETRKIVRPLVAGMLNNEGCSVDGEPDSVSYINLNVLVYYPVMQFPGKCHIYGFSTKLSSSHENSSAVVGKKDVYGLSESKKMEIAAARRQAEMAAAAAQKARERAYQQSILAHTERMADVTRKAEEGRLKIEDGPNGKQMTYGSGNWSGKASAGTTAAINQNLAEAERNAAIAQASNEHNVSEKDIVKTGEIVISKDTEKSTYTSNAIAEVTIDGGKKEIFVAPMNSTVERICTNQSGPFVPQTCEFKTNGNDGDGRWVHWRSIMGAALQKRVEGKVKKSLENMKAKDSMVKAEGMLQHYYYGADFKNLYPFGEVFKEISGTKKETKVVASGMFSYL